MPLERNEMDSFDLIVVGAGPAGSTAALEAARSGFKVLLLERAKSAGEKNVFGGRVYAHVLKKLFPDYPESIPYERFVVSESVGLMDDDRCTTVNFADHRIRARDADSFVARRSRLDKWLSEKAEEAGAVIVTSTKVDDLLIQDGRVRGIVSGGDRLEASCVIDAEGVTATLSRIGGVRNDVTPQQMKVGVKETVYFGKDEINRRFSLDDEEGLAQIFVGYPSSYMPAGGAFLYTNSESVSIGIVVDPVELSSRRLEVHELLESFRLHPHMQRVLRGGKIIEYSAHMIPNSVPREPSNLVGDGFIVAGDAAGFFINNGYTYRGVDLAMTSGMAAARTFKDAAAAGSFDRSSLMTYTKHLEADGLMAEMSAAEDNYDALHNERIFSLYPKVVCDFMSAVFRVEGFGKRKLSKTAKDTISGRVSLLRMMRDLYNVYSHM
ncbi:MAG: FAD-dependent oxidoreductase [Thermoplasmata archaeon]|nr:FAD-dependent oxidoreductase [Candidatus Sysuiplasma acidicola]MDH2905760.1 FAD-dependent oxidoreductase [Methanomassiliicoccales archaeon]